VITREVILAAILDIILGVALLVAIIYVASLCVPLGD
jgi:hypothetical protein